MKKLFCTLLSAAAAVALLCGFTPSPQENSAGAGLITKTYETAEAISSLSVSDKYADVTVKADDVDHVVVEYSYNSSYNDAFGTGGELYSFTIAGPSLNIQGLKGDASMSVNNSKCICTMTVKLPRRAFAGLTVDTSNGNTGWTSIVAPIWLLGGIQLLALGIVGEYIGKIYLETKHRPRYEIEAMIINQNGDKE